MPVQEAAIFPDDTYFPEKLNIKERQYLLKHLGDHPNCMSQDVPDQSVDVPKMTIVLDRMYRIQDVKGRPADQVRSEVKQSTQNSLEAYKRRQDIKAAFGHFPYEDVGVSHKVGDMTGFLYFPVPLDTKVRPTAKGVMDDLIGATPVDTTEIKEPKTTLDNMVVTCPWCDETRTGARALQGIDPHVRAKHQENTKEWNDIKKEIKAEIEALKNPTPEHLEA